MTAVFSEHKKELDKLDFERVFTPRGLAAGAGAGVRGRG